MIFLMLLFSIFPLRICGNLTSLLTTDVLIKCTGCRFLMRFLSGVAIIYAVWRPSAWISIWILAFIVLKLVINVKNLLVLWHFAFSLDVFRQSITHF